jgi:cytosine/adenosine deaminase-related metal-dependent hydrolase
VPGCGSRVRAISTPVRLSADWLYSGTGEIIPSGSILTGGEGRIVAAGPDTQVPTNPSIPSRSFPGAVLLPGLVNAHTHLELTGLDGKAEEPDFAEWIRTVIRLKSQRSQSDFLAASKEGLRQGYSAGVTTVADTGDSGAPFDALLELGGSGIAYLEVFGPDPTLAEAQFAAFRTRVMSFKERQTSRVRLGLSPHAPYSVSGPLYSRVARFGEEEGLPLAVHIAESAAESELLEKGDGAFARQWQLRGIPLPSLPGRSPVTWLEEHEVLGPRTLCIHVIRADADDLARLARYACPVAHCPRSNRRHHAADAPLAQLLAKGIRVGVGTDSPASVHPQDLMAEVRAARVLAGLSATQALDLVLLGAARAIGFSDEVGSLEPGKFADCVVLELPPGTSQSQCAEAIIATGRAQVAATFLGGREVFRKP